MIKIVNQFYIPCIKYIKTDDNEDIIYVKTSRPKAAAFVKASDKKEKKDVDPLERENEFWKISKFDFVCINTMCKNCRDHNKTNTSYEVIDDRLYETRSFCKSCVKGNIRVGETVYFASLGSD